MEITLLRCMYNQHNELLHFKKICASSYWIWAIYGDFLVQMLVYY